MAKTNEEDQDRKLAAVETESVICYVCYRKPKEETVEIEIRGFDSGKPDVDERGHNATPSQLVSSTDFSSLCTLTKKNKTNI